MSFKLELTGTQPEETNPAATVQTEADALSKTVLAEVKNEVKAEADNLSLQLQQLSTEEQRMVDDFSKQIDLHNTLMILGYGEKAQRKLDEFADKALKGVTGSEVGEIGNLLSQMTGSIEDFNETAEGKLMGIFRNAKKKAKQIQVKYESVSTTLERVKKELLSQKNTLLVDIEMLEKMYDQNLEYYKELTMYILAGQKKLAETRAGELEALRQKADAGGAQNSEAFTYNDLVDRCNSFEQQLSDLELTRAICLNMAPQIRMVQRTDQRLVQKIQSSINNTIPVWKQNVAIAASLQHTEEAAQAQKNLANLTGKMLEDNARRLHTSVVAATRESERGIVDVQAILNASAETFQMIADVNAEREAGHLARVEASKQLQQSSDKMKKVLLEASQRAS